MEIHVLFPQRRNAGPVPVNDFYLWLKFWIAANEPMIHPNSWGALFIEQRAGRVFIP